MWGSIVGALVCPMGILLLYCLFYGASMHYDGVCMVLGCFVLTTVPDRGLEESHEVDQYGCRCFSGVVAVELCDQPYL